MKLTRYNSLTTLFICVGIVFILAGCKSSTGSDFDEDDRPEIPTMEGIDMDISYFQTNQPPQGESGNEIYENYMEARSLVIEKNLELTTVLDELVTLQVHNAASGGGHPIEELWRWLTTYNFNYNTNVKDDFLGFHLGLLEVLVLAQVNDALQEATWEVFVSGCIEGEEETQIDDPCFEFGEAGPEDMFEFSADHKLMDGDVSLDHTSGNWHLYLPTQLESDPPYIAIEWTFSSDQNKTFKVSETDDALLILEVAYSRVSEDYRIEISGTSVDTPTVIGWDTALQEGYLERPNLLEMICWDGDLQNREC